MHIDTTTHIEVSTEYVEGPTQIGEYLICSAGFTADFEPRNPVQRDQVEAVKAIFAQCRHTTKVMPDNRLTIGCLKHDVERLMPRSGYISRGAVLVAAFEMNIAVVPIFDERYPADEGFQPVSAYIGINYRDIERLKKWA
ncbi:hypothetical protein ACWAT4_27425 [Bradyrhizobium manausense]